MLRIINRFFATFFHGLRTRNFLIFLIALSASIFYLHDFFLPIYYGFSNFLVNCADFGQYSDEAQKYAQNGIYLKNIINFGKEPGLFLVIRLLHDIIGTNIKISYLITDITVHTLSICTLGILVNKFSNNKTYGIFAAGLGATMYLFSMSYLMLFSRQLLGSLFLLLLAYTGTIKRKTAFIITLGIFFGMSILSHRVAMLIAGIAIFIFYIYRLITKKLDVNKILYGTLLGCILAGIYLHSQIAPTIDTIFWNIQRGKGEIQGDVLESYEPGWSFFEFSGSIYKRGILHFFDYEGIILIMGLVQIKKVFRKNKNGNQDLYFIILVVLLIYVSLKITFSVRTLITLEPFLIPILCINLYFDYSKIKKIIVFSILITLGMSGFYDKIPLVLKRVFETESSVEYIKNNIIIDKSFIITPNCSNDLITQMGYTTGVNLNNKLDKISRDKSGAENIDMYQGTYLSNILFESIIKFPYAHESLSGKDLYLVYGKGTDPLIMKELANSQNPIYKSSYIKLMYKNDKPSTIFKYIFKIDTSQIHYFDSLNYLRKNLIKN